MPVVAFRLIVVKFDVFKNGLLELADAGERAAAQTLLGQISKPALDQVQPGTAGRSEVHVKPWVTSQPPPYLGMLVGRIVICHQVQFSLRIGRGIDVLQKLDPLLVSMPRHTRINHNAFRHVEHCEQRGGAVALVIVGPGAQTAGINRQALLHAIEGLNLRLLVDAQHNGMLWWVQIQADDVHQLLGEMRIVGDLERLHAMRLEIGLLPHPLHHRRRRAQVLGQRPRAPMRGGRRCLSGGRLHNPSREFLFGRRGTTAACGILLNPGQPLLGEAVATSDRLSNVPSSSAISLFCWPVAAASTILARRTAAFPRFAPAPGAGAWLVRRAST